MTMNPDELKRLRELATSIPFKEWITLESNGKRNTLLCVVDRSMPYRGASIARLNAGLYREQIGEYIAAANPSVITAPLDHIDALKKQANAGRELAEQELRQWWHAFTQCDRHPKGFLDRMELFGLVFSKECTQDDFDQEAFATERGIEVGYPIWILNEAGHKAYDAAVADNKESGT